MDYTIDLPIIDNEGYKKILFLVSSSKEDLHEALETLAGYFKKEFRYDNLQYCKSDDNSNCFGFLITERAMDLVQNEDHHPARIIGGGCFRLNEVGGYKLDWIWFHPFARNRGNLKKLWPKFREKFGDFTVTEPLSAHMKFFLDRHKAPCS